MLKYVYRNTFNKRDKHELAFSGCLINNKYFYNMVHSSGQDKPIPLLSLATQAGKMALSCPLGITRCVPQEKACSGKTNQFLRCELLLERYSKRSLEQWCSL